MQDLVRTLTQASGAVLLLLILVVAVQSFFLLRLARQLNAHNRRWRQIARDASGLDLETILANQARERAELQALFEGSQGRLARLEDSLALRKGRLGMIRYDAFPDVGGEHSFSLALVDDAGDGAVISSIVGREEGRVYCKGIIEGRSDRAITDEERRAIEAARNGKRPVGR